MSAWVLPDHIADVLPSEARHIEELRRELLDTARGYGYELVMPPLLEHLESLLTGTGEALDLQTFKLVDQLSGRMMGLRADTTPQVARIDAHLLNRQGVARLCYCGPVLHTRPDRPHATREPLQFGAEIYGHAGLEADLEIAAAGARLPEGDAGCERPVTVDMADARIVRVAAGRRAGRRRGTRARACGAGRQGRERAARADARLSRARRAKACWRWSRSTATRRCWTKPSKVLPAAPALRAGAVQPEAGWRAPSAGRQRQLRPGRSARLRLLQRRALRASTRRAPATRWCAAAATTRSARCSAATGRPSASAWTCKELVGRGCQRGRCGPRSARPGGDGEDAAALRAAIAALREQRRNRGLRAAGPRQRSRRIPLRPRAAPSAAGQWRVQAI